MSAVRIRATEAAPRVARADLIAIAVPALVGALLCAVELNTRSLWVDEGATFAIASQHGAALWRGIAHDGGNMLLYYLAIHVVISLFGTAAWVLRLPSLIGLAATGALTAALGLQLLGDRRQALAAGLLTVVSLPLVFWGQDARGYSLMVTFAAASMLAYAMIVLRSGSRSALAAYVLSTLAALYVGYDAGLVVLAQLALLPLFKERARTVLIALATVAVFSIPLLVLAIERGSGQLFWVPPLSASVLGQTAQTLISAALPAKFHSTATTVIAEIFFGGLGAAAIALAAQRLRAARERRDVELWLVVAWLLVPAAVALVVSAAGEPIELDRCCILLMPALALLLVWALARICAHPRLPRWLGAWLFAALLVFRLAQVLPSYGSSPENWRAATAYVLRADAGRPACVAFYPQDGRQVFDYYLGAEGRRLTPVLPTLAWSAVQPYVERYDSLDSRQLAAIGKGCPQLFLLASHVGQSNGPALSRAHLRRYEELQAALTRLYPHHTSTSYGWAAPVEVSYYRR